MVPASAGGAAGPENSDVAVLIVGAGPSGLAAAIELGHRGISCLVIEQNDRVGYAPRAKTTHIRTRELMRRWGIASDLAAVSPFGVDYPSDVIFATKLNGYLLAKIDNAFGCDPRRNDLYSEHAQWVPQYKLERVLRRHADSLSSVKIRFGVRLDDFQQTGAAVTATLRSVDGGKAEVCRAKFLIGADGARSTVRELLKIDMTGESPLSHSNLVIYRAPKLIERINLPKGIMYWLVNNDAPAGTQPMDEGDLWSFSSRELMSTPEDAKQTINRAAGFDVKPEVVSMDRWTAHALVADSYRSDCVFLIGDACHLHPPYGGFGMNMGIADGVDLGWKLAAVLGGWGGPALLDSYEEERRPVHLRVVNEAVINHKTTSTDLTLPGIDAEGADGDRIRREVTSRIMQTKIREFRTLGVVLGGRYAVSSVIVPDRSEAPPEHYSDYIPNAVPGSRAPHVWLEEGTAFGASLFDRFGSGFSLVVTDASHQRAAQTFAAAAGEAGVPVSLVAADRADIRDLYQTNFALVRPDQHVAWRGNAIPDNIDALLNTVTGNAPVNIQRAAKAS